MQRGATANTWHDKIFIRIFWMEIYAGDRGSGKTQKLIELCGRNDILIVFSNMSKFNIKRRSPSTRCFSIDELKYNRLLGIRGKLYFDDLDITLSALFQKHLFFSLDGEIINLSNGEQTHFDEWICFDKNKDKRDIAIVNYAVDNNYYTVCAGEKEVENLMNFNEKGFHQPITYKEFLDKAYYSQGINGFCLSEAQDLLKAIAKGLPVAAVSLRTKPQNHIQ
jgi:hypothetical protein